MRKRMSLKVKIIILLICLSIGLGAFIIFVAIESVTSAIVALNGGTGENAVSVSSEVTIAGNGQLAHPCPKYTRLTSPFGWRIHPISGTRKFHSGVDLAAPSGTPIYAAEAGTVTMSGYNGGYGFCVIINHSNGMSTLYAHSSKLLVSKGQQVVKGQNIALVGTTGSSTGNHLHFEVKFNGNCTDPIPYIGVLK